MLQKFLIAWAGLIVGIFIGYFLVYKTPVLKNLPSVRISVPVQTPKKQVVGFLPFWLIDKAQQDYSKYITTLNYFNLTIDSDGTILKYTKPGEADPGWHALFSGKVDSYLENARNRGIKLSLTVFNSNDKSINSILENPTRSAQNLVSDAIPVMKQYGFTDLNLDVEKPSDASPEARMHFAEFVGEVKKGLNSQKVGTLTIDASPVAFVKNTNLVDPAELIANVDFVILMAYDFHNPGSYVTGPVSPETGAGVVSEFDTVSAVKAALIVMPPSKLILGIPLYGYQWESINSIPRSATIPGTSIITSNTRAEDFLASCATCSAQFDQTDQEEQVIYKDVETGTYHQLFYPNKESTQAKVNLARKENLNGIALWALGYEGQTILQPLEQWVLQTNEVSK